MQSCSFGPGIGRDLLAQARGTTHAPEGTSHVLLAEDHEISQEVAATLLRQAGYTCAEELPQRL